jgi:hypothetical protein
LLPLSQFDKPLSTPSSSTDRSRQTSVNSPCSVGHSTQWPDRLLLLPGIELLPLSAVIWLRNTEGITKLKIHSYFSVLCCDIVPSGH